MSTDKSSALAQISRLISENNLSQEDIESLFDDDKSIFKPIFSLLGGLLLLTGVGILIGLSFADMGPSMQVLSTFGVAVVAFAVGCWAHAKNRAFAITLLLIPVLLEPFGAAVLFHHTLPEQYALESSRLLSSIILGVMSLQYIAAGLYFKNIKPLLPIGILFFAGLFLWRILPFEGAYSIVEAVSVLGVFVVILAQSYYFEKISGANSWYGIPYIVGTVGFVLAGANAFGFGIAVLEPVLSLIAMVMAFAMFAWGKHIKRNSVAWTAIVCAIFAYVFFAVDFFESTYVSALMLLLAGLVSLFGYKGVQKTPAE